VRRRDRVNRARVNGARTVPDAGIVVPSIALRLAFVAIALLLAVVQFAGFPAGLVAAALLAVAAAVWPRTMLGWAVLMLLGASMLWHEQRVDWRLFVLIAGVHALHVLASQLLWLRWRGGIQASALGRPFLRFVLIQAPTQLAALVVLAVAPAGRAPWFAILGAAALVTLALVLARPLLRERLDSRA